MSLEFLIYGRANDDLNNTSNNCNKRVCVCIICYKPYLLYGADVINWNNSDLSSIRHAFNSAMCKIYKVKFQLLDCIYDFTNQHDILPDISKRRRFELELLSRNNSVIKLLHASS